VLAALVGFATAAAGTWWLLRPDVGLTSLDVPNERSMHSVAVPRGGGLAVLAGLLFSLAVVSFSVGFSWPAAAIFFALLLIAGISFVDDRKSLGVAPRLAVHFIAAGVALWGADLVPLALAYPGGAVALTPVVATVLSALAVVWLTNLYNFMDGMDGFAGGMAVIGFATIALLAGTQAPLLGAIALLTSAAAAGFLVFNFPPAQIFMGDVGASALGFLAAALILWGDVVGVFPWWIGTLAFAVFIVDATVTLIRRGCARQRIWKAHRSHFYQRLVAIGWSQPRAVMLHYVLMLLASMSALLANGGSLAWQCVILTSVVLMLLALMAYITLHERRR